MPSFLCAGQPKRYEMAWRALPPMLLIWIAFSVAEILLAKS
jgi:hypothetical protein